MPGYIHHVEWCVSDLYGQVQVLVSHYGFEPVAQRLRKIQDDFVVEQIIVRSGATRFMLTQKTSNVQAKVRSVQDDEYPVLVCCPGQDHVRDTVFNVALKIGPNVDEITEKIQDLDANSVLVAPNDKCHSRLSVVKSCCGNVIHSLLENDFDPYPPGFEAIQTNVGQVWNENWLRTTHMDHVTYVCHPGQSQKILQWYNSVFKMKRFLVNPQESIEDGVEISGDVNMRLSVGEWLSSWMCREEGVQFQNDSKLNFKLVLAEPLDNEKGSHVQNFLDGHGGPGLQHIGLTTPNACQTVSVMSKNGAQFRKPPPTYYQLESKVREILEAGEDLDLWSQLGLLLDAETADFDNSSSNSRYLMQIFTKPVFGSQDTFFLEVLERRGANGFGAGNITALAQSIILYQKQLKMQK